MLVIPGGAALRREREAPWAALPCQNLLQIRGIYDAEGDRDTGVGRHWVMRLGKRAALTGLVFPWAALDVCTDCTGRRVYQADANEASLLLTDHLTSSDLT